MLNVEYTAEPDAIEKEASLRAASKHMMKNCLLGDPPRNSIIDLHRSNAIVRKAESMMMAHMESWYNEQIQNVCNRFVLSVKKCPVKYESVRDKIDMHKRYRSSIKKKLRNDWIEGRKSSYQKLVRLRRQSEMKTLEEAMEDAKGNGEAIVVERGARTSLENICETSANEKDRFAYQRTLPVFDNSFNDSSDDDEDEGNVFGSIRHWSHQHDDAITRARRTKENMKMFKELGISTVEQDTENDSGSVDQNSEIAGGVDDVQQDEVKACNSYEEDKSILSDHEKMYINMMYQIIDMDDSQDLSMDELRHWLPNDASVSEVLQYFERCTIQAGAYDDEGVVTATEWANLWSALVEDEGKGILNVFIESFNKQAKKELGDEGFDVVQHAIQSAEIVRDEIDSSLYIPEN